MKVVDPGHAYELNYLDSEYPVDGCYLVFVKREGPKFPGNVGHHSGTTSQEVLRALIDRAFYVNNQQPYWQTRLSIWLMGFIVWMYEHRAAKRHSRKVPRFYEATFGETCAACGHVGCRAGRQG